MKNSSIANKIVNGTFWTLIQTILMKLISFGGQIILAWILMPEDFGKIALVYTITNVSSLMQQFGLQDVLIKRGRAFNLWYPLSFGLTSFISVLSVFVAVLCGYIGSYFYNDILIFYLVLIFAISMPFQALSLLPDTLLKIKLKFKQISIFKILEIFSIQFGIIIFAFLNFGVYSFVIPLVITAIIRCIYLFYYTKLKIVRPQFSRWKSLTYNSMQGLFFAISSRLSMQVDVILLGLISTQAVVGIYYMGMTLSIQVIGFIGVALPSILFPTLMSYSGKDLNKALIPLQKVVIYMSLIGVPFACWQGANAKPLITLFLSDKWLPSIILVQILSVGMIFRLISSAWVVPLKLRGDFKGMSIVTFNSLILLIIIIVPLGYFFKATGIALGVSLFYFVNTPYLIFKGFQSYFIDYRYMLYNCLKIIFIGIFSYGITFFLSENITYFEKSLIFNFLLNTIVSTVIYILGIYLFLKTQTMELFNKIRAYKN
jgi:O-antigen/teichoic acid export membrane protein